MPGDGEYIYFSDRLACPAGSIMRGTKRERCSANFCCPKTQVETLKWNHEIRGKCWVLRPFWHADSKGNYSPEGATEDPDVIRAASTKTRVSVSTAYGIIGVTTLFVVTFRIVTRKLDDWKRTVRTF